MYQDKNHLLYIGLNGYAGSGKDTVAKMLSVILNNPNIQKEEAYKKWYTLQKNTKFATFNRKDELGNTICLAFADKLKKIAAEIFAIPIEHFYNNKSTGWINISGNFEYTEQEPWSEDYIITAEDYASSGPQYYQHLPERYWMSIREILVYVGTYILQREINKNVFINITENRIKNHCRENDGLKYAICTDVRFEQEADFIRSKNGILINIVRSDVLQLNNVAEHDLDEENDYNFVIENDGTYEDLWDKVWDLVHSQDIFRNEIVRLPSHDGSDNFLRLIREYSEENKRVYKLCPEFEYTRVSHEEDGSVFMVDPSGGPMLTVGMEFEFGKLKGWKIKRIVTKAEPFGFYLTLVK